ncbi:phospholipase A and acyltransferase 3-like isoform X2 [Nerophis lumbriciformis]|uniref:phospholipase A and acyltransferase 3-like isoform X2 n=1 Tax=Nerophis lumbriciformis TaxID=546530 RepID=UPI002ADF2776|nr:phospholipase A and acyltransferase 3-like isoform X2 [Nerophis lumbriciformis]
MALEGRDRHGQREVKPQPGDLIEIFRPGYQHWALYVGDDLVVHVAPPSECAGAGPSSMMSILADRGLVKMEELWTVVGNDRYQVNNILDDEYQPRPVYVILREAKRLVGHMVSYSLFSANCEHFVTNLRYGKPESRQVCQAVEATAWTGLGLGAAALTAVALVEWTEKKKQERQRQEESACIALCLGVLVCILVLWTLYSWMF